MKPTITLNTFKHNGNTYIKIIPSKRLFNSTMVHEVVNRGDLFALNIETGEFTIIPGKEIVTHSKMDLYTSAQQELFPTTTADQEQEMQLQYDRGFKNGLARGSLNHQKLILELSGLIRSHELIRS